MHKESGHTALDEIRTQWRLMTVYERFEQVVAITLSGVSALVIVISLIQLIRLVFTLLGDQNLRRPFGIRLAHL